VRRIIGIGNRLVADDAIGPRVLDALARRDLPPDVDLVEGGLAGLDLLASFPGCERIVLVDAVSGFGAPGEAVTLAADEAAVASDGRYDHAAGLDYLLSAWSRLVRDGGPEVRVLGVETPATDDDLEAAASRALSLVVGDGGA